MTLLTFYVDDEVVFGGLGSRHGQDEENCE